MKQLDSLLLAAQVVISVLLGVVVTLMLAPYVLDVGTVEGVGKGITGLKTGVGDIAGGILGGVTAVASALGVQWLRDRREEHLRAEQRAVKSHQLLLAIDDIKNVMSPWYRVLSIPQQRGHTLHHLRHMIPIIQPRLAEIEKMGSLAETLGPEFYEKFAMFKSSASVLLTTAGNIPEAFNDDAGVNEGVWAGFKRLWDETEAVHADLMAFRQMNP